MKSERIDELEAICNAATKGKWEASDAFLPADKLFVDTARDALPEALKAVRQQAETIAQLQSRVSNLLGERTQYALNSLWLNIARYDPKTGMSSNDPIAESLGTITRVLIEAYGPLVEKLLKASHEES